MTAILDDIRRLDAAHARGEITASELVAAKAELMDSVPEVHAVVPSPIPPPENPSRPGIGAALLLCALILIVCIGAALLLTGDVMLAATLAITVLAALTVVLFRQLDG